MEKFWKKCIPSEEKLKEVLADELRRAVPEHYSIADKAKAIARILNEEQHVKVDWRTCQNWLNADHLPHMRYLCALGVLIGAEKLFRLIAGEDLA